MKFITRQLVAWLFLASLALAQSARKPNVIFILVDDMGYADLSSFGSKDIRTPNIDRLTKGLSVLTAYTWSKWIDNTLGVNGFSEGVQDWDNLAAERSISSNNLPHRLTSSVIYDLPFGKSGPAIYRVLAGGWQINGILTLQSGNPIGVTAGARRVVGG